MPYRIDRAKLHMTWPNWDQSLVRKSCSPYCLPDSTLVSSSHRPKPRIRSSTPCSFRCPQQSCKNRQRTAGTRVVQVRQRANIRRCSCTRRPTRLRRRRPRNSDRRCTPCSRSLSTCSPRSPRKKSRLLQRRTCPPHSPRTCSGRTATCTPARICTSLARSRTPALQVTLAFRHLAWTLII